MPVTLEKAPRCFTVLMKDGTVEGILLTPDTEEDLDHLRTETYWGHCLNLYEVTAVDGYDAHTQAVAIHDRTTAIQDYMDRIGVGYDVASTIYMDCRIWARALGANGRASWLTHDLKTLVPLKHFALIEVMRENGEPTTA